jgi:hypothetical protein
MAKATKDTFDGTGRGGVICPKCGLHALRSYDSVGTCESCWLHANRYYWKKNGLKFSVGIVNLAPRTGAPRDDVADAIQESVMVADAQLGLPAPVSEMAAYLRSQARAERRESRQP